MLRSITKRRLVEMLEDFDDDTPVVLQYDYGDHLHTQAVARISDVIETTLVETGYSQSGYAVPREDTDAEPDGQAYLVIR